MWWYRSDEDLVVDWEFRMGVRAAGPVLVGVSLFFLVTYFVCLLLLWLDFRHLFFQHLIEKKCFRIKIDVQALLVADSSQ